MGFLEFLADLFGRRSERPVHKSAFRWTGPEDVGQASDEGDHLCFHLLTTRDPLIGKIYPGGRVFIPTGARNSAGAMVDGAADASPQDAQMVTDIIKRYGTNIPKKYRVR